MDYEQLASWESIDKTVQGLQSRSYYAVVVKTGADALAKIKEMIPDGAGVMNGSSQTLEQIGFIDYLKAGEHAWDHKFHNLHEEVLAEHDPVKQEKLRKEAVLSDYYLGSVHALAETGEFVFGSMTGSQLPHVTFTSANLIFIVSTKKIVPTIEDAIKRLKDFVVPSEDKRMIAATGSGTKLNKMLVFNGEYAPNNRKINFILVEEPLGF